MSDISPPNLDVDYQLTRLLKRTRSRTLHYLPRLHPSLDYSSYIVLIAIHENGGPIGIRGSDLAELLDVHKSTISRTVTTLERLGLIRRVADPSDGRAHLLVLSDQTLAEIDAIRRERQAYLSQTLEKWQEQDLSEFARLLGALNADMDAHPFG